MCMGILMIAGWNVEELNKAYALITDLAASMMFILLLEDLKEVPGGTHDWMYSCHGWAILFLQVSFLPSPRWPWISCTRDCLA